jgi:Tol biopolymer transport system component
MASPTVAATAPAPATSSAAVVAASAVRPGASLDRTAVTHEASPVRAVSVSTGPTFSPAFAPSGTALFFHAGGSSDARSSLQAADLNGEDPRLMTIVDDGANNYHVRPSPDGTRVAFDSNRDGERAVYVANRDGTDAHRVSGPGFAAVPTWSPDGTTLAFSRAEPDRPQVWNLWLQNLETSQMRRLTSYRFGQTWSASWFPDGRRICYSHDDRLIVRDLDGHSIREYPTPIARSVVRTPAVSPDGRHVMFQVAGSGAWLLDLRDESMRCVLSDPTAEEFAWSPDGRRVAFHSRRDGEWSIWLMTPS